MTEKEEKDLLLCSLESIKFAQRIEHMHSLPHRIRSMPKVTEGDIEGIERSLRIMEKSCGIKFKKAWETIQKAKDWLEKKDVSMAVLVIDRVKRDVEGDIVEQF